ncbi:rhamnogalacturonyl hydrolase YesR [Sphingopyxis panaciterrae]|uniref:glycoside hydrolase family 88/105 protein n=1 Tax=Sphingopyxis panaciterrae TaxID=363841 RepID=UPI001422E8FF|nr:glycoside hydrolase family 88 protein [Sphingopyxis panaciterrae]NIJ39675.1 rhamnogalacturonyl hydrolase YesR [Sphingopyxis panaciterrae]
MSLSLLAPLMLISASAAAPAEPVMPQPADILVETRRVADWQLAHRAAWDKMPAARPSVRNPRDWQQATFWVALTDLAERDIRYRDPVIELGRAEAWQLGKLAFHADDQLIAQAWEWAARNGAGDALAPSRAYFDNVLTNRRTNSLEFTPTRPGGGYSLCTERWCWCDALFMAPPTMLRIGIATGDPRYAAFVHAEWKATTDYLYDPGEDLYFRDSRFFGQRDAKGRKLFWSRGNGWVMGGLVRVLQVLGDDDPQRPYYEGRFRKMAAKLVTLQKADGYWPASLLDQDPGTPPEASGTAFFTYAFAWGVDNGLLDRKVYEPAAVRGWTALGQAVQPDGMLGWVQQVGDRPDSVSAHETQFYGTGAFILAGTAMYDLAQRGRRHAR